MSTAGYRALIALANLLLVSAILYVGFRTFVGGAAGVQPPSDFDPIAFKVEVTNVKRSEIGQHQVVWNQLDPAPPPPPTGRHPLEPPASQSPAGLEHGLSAAGGRAGRAHRPAPGRLAGDLRHGRRDGGRLHDPGHQLLGSG